MSRDQPVVLFANQGTKLHPAPDPRRSTVGACGLDLFLSEDVVIPPLSTCRVLHRLSFLLPTGYFGQVLLRPGSASIDISVRASCVDSDQRGDLIVFVKNERLDASVKLQKDSSYWRLVIQPHFTGIVGKSFVQDFGGEEKIGSHLPLAKVLATSGEEDKESSGFGSNDEEEEAALLEYLRLEKEEEEEAARAGAEADSTTTAAEDDAGENRMEA